MEGKTREANLNACPPIWHIGCILFSILVFPTYLIRRRKRISEQNSSN
jgi:hypothetical protein